MLVIYEALVTIWEDQGIYGLGAVATDKPAGFRMSPKTLSVPTYVRSRKPRGSGGKRAAVVYIGWPTGGRENTKTRG